VKKFVLLLGILCGALWLSIPAPSWADQERSASPHTAGSESPKRYWDDATTSLRRGSYRDALQSLEVILTLTPNDPWAQLYHALCELRLQSSGPFPQLSASEEAELKARLQAEERLKRRSVAQHKALERQYQKEQTQWDREVKLLSQQAEREERLQRKKAQAEAVQHARAERAKSRELTQQHALREAEHVQPAQEVAPQPSEGTATTPREEPSSSVVDTPRSETQIAPSASTTASAPEKRAQPQQLPAGAVTEEPSIELPAVIVPTAPASSASGGAASTAPAQRPVPPSGAIQINAQQMSVSPDRKLAIAEGNVEVVFEDAFLTCDHLTLFTDTKDMYAEGRVRLERGTEIFRGEMVHYNLTTKKGRFLQGTIAAPVQRTAGSAFWYEHGRSAESIAEGVYEVTPGYLTSCDEEPPHFQFQGQRAIFFAGDSVARAQNATLLVDRLPILYLPFISFTEKQSPFFIIPGKHKPWGPFALMGYRYEAPALPGGGTQRGTLKLDWRRYFLWGFGVDHKIDSPTLGTALLKLYYNNKGNMREQKSALPKGAAHKRYRVLWRHRWTPLPDTTVITDIQKFSDINFRKDFLFREEYTRDDVPESFISSVTNTPNYSLTALIKKRMNPFQTVTEAVPQVTLDVRPQHIGETNLFSESHLDVARFQQKKADTHNDRAVTRLDWFQQFKYALGLFYPIEVTPRAGIRQTFYSKDIQDADSLGHRDFFGGQFSTGVDASLKLFRIFPVVTKVFGLNVNLLRHVLTPTLGYSYIHRPTVPNALLNFTAASGATNQFTFGLENKLQTKRPIRQQDAVEGKVKEQLQSVDLARFLISTPYTFHGSGNKQGGRLGNWDFRFETYPWSWMRLESNWTYRTHLSDTTLQNDDHFYIWNLDLVMVGGKNQPLAQSVPGIQGPTRRAFQPGANEGGNIIHLMPQGQWYLGLGHRYSENDKTEDVLEYDWRFSPKWQLSTFHRFTWKEDVGGAKRFNNLRERQYALRRDLHDWVAEVVYHVDREFGEELYFTLTLKAFPEIPIQMSDSYHQPKVGSQSSPFAPGQFRQPGT